MLKRNTGIFLCLVMLLQFSACKSEKEAPQTSGAGLKNMAAVQISEELIKGLDVEPNNIPANASEIKFQNDEIQVLGHLGPEDGSFEEDVDVYKIIGKKGGIIANITVTPLEPADLILEVSGTDKKADTYTVDNAGVGEPETYANVVLQQQGVYVTVRGRNKATIPYSLHITRLMAEGNEIFEEEPNNVLPSAQLIDGAADIMATLYGIGDIDFYRIAVKTHSRIRIEPASTAMEITLTSENKEVWHALSTGTALVSPTLAPASKPYQLRIAAMEAPGQTQKYQIMIEDMSADENSQGNNSVQTAKIIQSQAAPTKLSFNRADETQYFMLEVPQTGAAAQRMTLRVQGDERAGLSIQVVNEADAALPNFNQGNSKNIVCNAPVNGGEKYYIRVQQSPVPSLTYPLNYQLYAHLSDATTVESEPNDMPSLATPLEFGKPIKGNILSADDIDIYRVTVPEVPGHTGPLGKLTIRTAPGYIASLRIKVQDEDGGEISRIENETFSAPMTLAFDAPASHYDIILSGAGDNCLKPYEIQARFEPFDLQQAETAPADPGAAPNPDGTQPDTDNAMDAGLAAILDAAKAENNAQNPNQAQPPEIIPAPNLVPLSDRVPQNGKTQPTAPRTGSAPDEEDAF